MAYSFSLFFTILLARICSTTLLVSIAFFSYFLFLFDNFLNQFLDNIFLFFLFFKLYDKNKEKIKSTLKRAQRIENESTQKYLFNINIFKKF